VYATDIDDLALEMVDTAAAQQRLSVETHGFDFMEGITGNENKWLNLVDLIVFSDVFESATVARGAARLSHLLFGRVWVFTQSDRAQREAFLETPRDLQQTCAKLHGTSFPFQVDLRSIEQAVALRCGRNSSYVWLNLLSYYITVYL
jgi:hypothetical protein